MIDGMMILRLYRIVLLGMALCAATPAMAHHQISGPTSGLAIPSLTHGEMQVVSAHRSEVLELADRQFDTDPSFRKLRNFVELQHAFCLWGIMPGSVTDEASPFNECAHAELAAVQSLLLHMIDMPAARGRALAIKNRIESGEQALTEWPVRCQFSDEPFNTADVIGPRWSDVPGHTPTLFVCLAALAFTISAITGLWAGALTHTPTGESV